MQDEHSVSHDRTGRQVDGVLIAALEQSIDAVVIIDGRNEVSFFNAAAERLWGRDRNEVLGQNVRMLVPEAVRPHHDGYVNANRGGASDKLVGTIVEVPIHRPDGTRRVGSLSLSRIRADGEIHYAAFVKDMTDDVRRREDLYLLSLVANETDRAVIITDERQKIVYCNAAFTQLFGYQRDEVMGRMPVALLAGRHSDREVVRQLNRVARNQHGMTLETISYGKDGREIWISVTVNPVFDAGGVFRHAVSVIANVTETRQTQVLQQTVLEAVAKDQTLPEIATLICQQVEAIAPGVMCSVLRVDRDGIIHPLASPSLPEHYSQALEGLIVGPQTGSCGTKASAGDAACSLIVGPQTGSCGTAAWRGEPVVVEDIATDPLWTPYKELALPLGLAACWSTPIKLKDGRVAGTFAFYFREKRGPSAWHERLVEACVHLCALAIERHEEKAHIAQLAYFDTLTGLPNRTRLGGEIDECIARAANENRRMAVLFLDVDHFKDVNDTLGHSAGDALLVEIARRLQKQLRAGDIVSRLGGDEFVIILDDCEATHASAVADRILAALAQPIEIDTMALPVSASIGISLFPEDGGDREALLKHADTAMYEAKNAGRGTHRFFSPEMNRIAQERLLMGAALSESLALGLLELHYQPQVEADSGAIHGVEALARWRHPAFGDVSPARFIAVAEECGLIEAIGEWALREACRQMAEWRRRGLEIPTVSVNLSPLHFRNRRLPELIVEATSNVGLPAGVLTVEITEGIMMDDCPSTAATIEQVAGLGVRLSLDDFGTGYSSLASISTLPIEEIKLDRSFMRDLGTDKNARAVASAVVRIGRSLGLTVVAEGVETEAQRRFLQGLRCHVLQGYLFAPAMRAGELESWLAGRRGNVEHQVA
ncbi:MAG: EAL domain-containing protein [Phreatobacter sp.]|uniref:EAL domain-containing protein n=1 Tax=Phreatobacter sp. TaxID=1966341 RepID=UPI001A475F11|nr:EAL domain-containing protein [Phreatobacter sp.]MBL8571407.1 EAL domain-containing protein [Phreatobacter sp.]